MSLTVACVLKSGGVYDATWVARLKAGVAKHLPMEHRFVCFSDADVPCSRIKLEHDWPGWWSKIEMFRMPGPMLYLDLDTAIVGDLTDIANVAINGGFTILRDFYRFDGFGSGLMAWGADFDTFLWYSLFRSSACNVSICGGRGDQNFIEQQKPDARIWQDALPGQIVSYKRHCTGGPCPVDGHMRLPGIPDNARVVCLHGLPKFADMPANDAVRRAWELAA